MSKYRAEQIRAKRLKQPIEELQRKAQKSAERARLWTQEELDAADAEARKIAALINPPETKP